MPLEWRPRDAIMTMEMLELESNLAIYAVTNPSTTAVIYVRKNFVQPSLNRNKKQVSSARSACVFALGPETLVALPDVSSVFGGWFCEHRAHGHRTRRWQERDWFSSLPVSPDPRSSSH